jgi:predicted PurR-regulated permease PerM
VPGSLVAVLGGVLVVTLFDLERGVWMLGVVLLVQVIEGNVLQPWIQGRASACTNW